MPGTICRRCSNCAIDWPSGPHYLTCPVCNESTWSTRSESTLTDDEARKTAAYMRFDQMYCLTRGVASTHDGDPALDPHRSVIPEDPCPRPHEEGFICWRCDEIPRRWADGVLWICGDAVWLEPER